MTTKTYSTGDALAEIKPPCAAFYGVEVTQENESDEDVLYVARLVSGGEFLLGTGPTPLEAFYDLCEIIAEFGIDGEGRNYPPSLRQRFIWWWRSRVWWRIVGLFEKGAE